MITSSHAYSRFSKLRRYLLRALTLYFKQNYRALALGTKYFYTPDIQKLLARSFEKRGFMRLDSFQAYFLYHLDTFTKSRYRRQRKCSRFIPFGRILRHFTRKRINSVPALANGLHFYPFSKQNRTAALRSKQALMRGNTQRVDLHILN